MSMLFIIAAIFLGWVMFPFWKNGANTYDKTNRRKRASQIRHLQDLAADCDIAARLVTLIARDGAGEWPPKARYRSWPAPLEPYQEVLHDVLPLLATQTPTLDARSNNERRERFRDTMTKLLREKVHLASVIKMLETIDGDQGNNLPGDVVNGLFSCLALSRHAHRWALMPVVKVAQLEDVVDLPPELEIPWPYLQRYFGFAADSGNHTSNVLLNFDEDGSRVFKFSLGLCETIQSTEEAFFKLLRDIETMGFDIFYEIALATRTYQDGQKDACLRSLRNIDAILSRATSLFHAQMRESQVSRKFWLSYVQGFHGWGVGKHIDGEFIHFNGVSGNQILLFQVLDAFLDIEPYLDGGDSALYVPLNQKLLCQAVRKASIRKHLCEDDTELVNEFGNIARKLKTYRVAHKSRVMAYLKQPAPERLHMTAGKSVLTKDENTTIDEAIAPLYQMLDDRLSKTV